MTQSANNSVDARIHRLLEVTYVTSGVVVSLCIIWLVASRIQPGLSFGFSLPLIVTLAEVLLLLTVLLGFPLGQFRSHIQTFFARWISLWLPASMKPDSVSECSQVESVKLFAYWMETILFASSILIIFIVASPTAYWKVDFRQVPAVITMVIAAAIFVSALWCVCKSFVNTKQDDVYKAEYTSRWLLTLPAKTVAFFDDKFGDRLGPLLIVLISTTSSS